MAEEQQQELESPTLPASHSREGGKQETVATTEAVEEIPENTPEAVQADTPESPEAEATGDALPESSTPEATAPTDAEASPETPEAEAEEARPVAEVVEEAPEALEEAPEALEEAPEVVEEAPEALEEAPEALEEAPEALEEAPEALEEAPEAVESEAGAMAVGEEEAPAAQADAPEAEEAASDDPVEETIAETDAPPAETEVATNGMPQKFGYTGEIVGRVVKLEDLEDTEEEEEIRPEYDQLKSLIEQTLTRVSEHEIVKGQVVSVGDKDVVIDIGFKSDGVVPKSEFDGELVPGDEVEVYLERIEDYHGQLVLSKTKADKFRRWERIEHAFNNETVLEGTIIRRIKGGMIVDLIDGLEAFLPGSQIDVRPVRDFDAYLDKRMEFKIVKINPTNENVVVSHKALIEKELEAQRESILATMQPGQILEGTVKNITDFGVFIDLGGVDGLLHITDLSWGRVSHPSELVELDQQLKIVVLDYDKERQRISLGLKQLQSHPWENINEKFTKSDTVEGKVVSITDYGAFVELEKGIEGLVHISEMSWTDHIRHPSQKVSLGQLVNVVILNIDHEGKKISLGMKQLEKNPWDGLAERYPPGTVLRGKVRNITNFGVFVEIEPGIDGLVHISDLSWTKKIRHPGEMIKKGQELDVVILDVDEGRQRVSLGHKQIETNPWNDFANVYAEGTDHTAKIAHVEDKGLVVGLGLDVEAFVPASELKNGPQNFKSNYNEGDEIELRVIRFDVNQKEIVLSESAKERQMVRSEREREHREKREVRRRDERTTRDFQKRLKATSGPTTLGELSGLEDLRAQMVAAEKEARKKSKTDKKAEQQDTNAAAEPTAEAKAAEAEAATEATAETEAAPEAEATADTAEAAVEADEKAEEPTAEAEEAVSEGEETPSAEAEQEAVEATADTAEAAVEADEKAEEPAAEAEEAVSEGEETPSAEAEQEAAEATADTAEAEQEAVEATADAAEAEAPEAVEEDEKAEEPTAEAEEAVSEEEETPSAEAEQEVAEATAEEADEEKKEG